MRLLSHVMLLLVAGAFVGCEGRTEMLPNRDKNLNRTPAQFAADAAKRHPYKADAARGGQAKARSEVNYVTDRLTVVNLSDTDWTDVEVWVNGDYVVYLPVMQPKALKEIPFQALFNGSGESFPTGNSKVFNRQPVVVQKVELFRDGKLYDVPSQLPE